MLAEQCQSNAPGAFDELYRVHAPRLFGLACRLTNRDEAEDVLQEIFLTAHRKLGQYRGESALGTWLFRLATNVCVDHLRRKGAKFAQLVDPLDGDVASTDASASGPILGVIDRMDLERAIAALPDGARAVFVLYDVEGFDHAEIGDLLGISKGASRARLFKARLRLRTELAQLRHLEPSS